MAHRRRGERLERARSAARFSPSLTPRPAFNRARKELTSASGAQTSNAEGACTTRTAANRSTGAQPPASTTASSRKGHVSRVWRKACANEPLANAERSSTL